MPSPCIHNLLKAARGLIIN